MRTCLSIRSPTEVTSHLRGNLLQAGHDPIKRIALAGILGRLLQRGPSSEPGLWLVRSSDPGRPGSGAGIGGSPKGEPPGWVRRRRSVLESATGRRPTGTSRLVGIPVAALGGRADLPDHRLDLVAEIGRKLDDGLRDVDAEGGIKLGGEVEGDTRQLGVLVVGAQPVPAAPLDEPVGPVDVEALLVVPPVRPRGAIPGIRVGELGLSGQDIGRRETMPCEPSETTW